MFTSFLCGVMAILAGVTDVASIVFHASRPDELKNAHYYEYGDNKTEQAARAYWEKIKSE